MAETYRDFTVTSAFGSCSVVYTPFMTSAIDLRVMLRSMPVSSWVRECRTEDALADRQWRKVLVSSGSFGTVWLSDVGDEFETEELIQWLMSGGVFAVNNGYGMHAVNENQRLLEQLNAKTAELTNLQRSYAASENANTILNEQKRAAEAKLAEFQEEFWASVNENKRPADWTILDDAAERVADRGEKYGDVEDNFRQIAELWTAYLSLKVSSEDVAFLMILLKVARRAQSTDTLADIAGYARCLERLRKEPQPF